MLDGDSKNKPLVSLLVLLSPDDTSPDDTSPDDTLPDDTSPDDTSPDDTLPDDTSPDDTSPKSPEGTIVMANKRQNYFVHIII